ncbi:HAD-IA family hydrolase [Calditrichota bacterium GD2]
MIGKPSARFFQLALDDLKLAGEEVLMIGDDVESDIMGAQRLGIRTCLVKTGKFRQQDVDRAEVKPDHIIESIARLPALLQDAGL